MDNKIDSGSKSNIKIPNKTLECPTAMAALSKMIESKPAFTAFMIFSGVLALYALKRGIKTINANKTTNGKVAMYFDS